MQLASLQNLSAYTLLKSPTKITDLVTYAKESGYDAVALTDINLVSGLVSFFQASKQAGIKPILGMQLRVRGIFSEELFDLILLAKTQQGYENLLKVSSRVKLVGAENVDVASLKAYFDDLAVITTANQHSELLAAIRSGNAEEYLAELAKLTKPCIGFYYGLDAETKRILIALSKKYQMPLIAVNDTKYLHPEDHFLQKVLAGIDKNEVIEDPIALSKEKGSHYLVSVEQMKAQFAKENLNYILDNTNKLAQMCQAEVVFKKPVLPKFKTPDNVDSYDFLRQLAHKGLVKRVGENQAKYEQQLTYELKVIHEMHFDDYFLIVWDVIKFCHQQKMQLGPGRGSACGSLVAYSLGITDVDPLEFNLLFERFLNPDRHEMPDIDLDIPDNRREEVVAYLFEQYGMDHAAQILTYSTFASKQVIRDTGRIFGISKNNVSDLTHLVPIKKTKVTLDEAYNEVAKFRKTVQLTPLNELWFKTAKALEGLPKHASVHAAGVVLSDQSIATISGLTKGSGTIPVTQETKKFVEKLGLLKIDLLGLRNLTILSQVLHEVHKSNPNFVINRVPLDDQKTLNLFKEAQTEGIFQFESDGIRRVLLELSPDSFDDLVATNALFRPGPMQNISHFIARKHGKEKVTYLDPVLEPILKDTYGILVYQEQVMKTAQLLAGFTLSEADILRRAISKKEDLAQYRDKFVQGVVKNGHSQATGEKVYAYIEQFADYGFNKSHAVAYTKLAFWLAYLRVNYPAAFYTAILNNNLGNNAKIAQYVEAAKAENIRFFPPAINQANSLFTVDYDGIRIGFSAIKGLRRDFISEMIAGRPFKSLEDFGQRISSKFLQEKVLESLVKAGTFDEFNQNRNALLANIRDFISVFKLANGDHNLLEMLGVASEGDAKTDFSNSELEQSVLGFGIAESPIAKIRKHFSQYDLKFFDELKIGDKALVACQLQKLKKIRTKKGQEMAFASFFDRSKIDSVIFPGIYDKVKQVLKEGDFYLVEIEVKSDNFGANKEQYVLQKLRKINLQKNNK
ncbi:MAG: DNA polymerase III subunit alpha [Lactobacillus sp.]|nr:DNA polymerase III subunit alpha [Lactobacillus sp.]